MKICVFSDIHGNGPAFDQAYPKILTEGADLNIFLGDLCGYYFDEIEIFRTLVQMPRLIALKGNHDKMFLAARGGDHQLQESYLKRYGSSLKLFLERDHLELVRWLEKRPEFYFLKEFDVACYHGGPGNFTEEYIYPDTDLEKFRATSFSNFFLGHTHYPMHRFIGEKMVVNPGSLGQPRHGGWPTYAVVDLSKSLVQFKEIQYDITQLIRRIDERGDQTPYIKNVLIRRNRP